MRGREQSEQRVKKAIEPLLVDYHELRDFYDYMSEKSYLTAKEYVTGVYKFLQFVDYDTETDFYDFDDLKKVPLKDVKKFINGNRMRYYEIKYFYHFLVVNGYVNENLCDKIESPKDRNEHKVVSLTVEEIAQIKDNILNAKNESKTKKKANEDIRRRDYAIVMLALTTGLRIGSIREINLEDLDLGTRELTITEKGNKTRTIYLSQGMIDIIRQYLPDREYLIDMAYDESKIDYDALFVSRNAGRISYNAINKMLKKYTSNIDKHITPHKLRSTCATVLYEHTQDVMVVKDTLGHQDVKTTMRYIGAAEERLRKSSSVMSGVLL